MSDDEKKKPVSIMSRKTPDEILRLAMDGNKAAMAAVGEFAQQMKRAPETGRCPMCEKAIVGEVRDSGEIHYQCGGHFAMSTYPPPVKKEPFSPFGREAPVCEITPDDEALVKGDPPPLCVIVPVTICDS